jgi:hypothetical protein
MALKSQETKQYTITKEVDGIRTIVLNDVKKRLVKINITVTVAEVKKKSPYLFVYF